MRRAPSQTWLATPLQTGIAPPQSGARNSLFSSHFKAAGILSKESKDDSRKLFCLGDCFASGTSQSKPFPWQVWGFPMEQKNKPSYCRTVKMVFFPTPKGVSRSEWEDFQCGLKKGRWSLEKREGQIKKNVLLVGWTLCNIRQCF